MFALNMTPFLHEVWSPASSASFGIRTYDPHTRGRGKRKGLKTVPVAQALLSLKPAKTKTDMESNTISA